MLCERIETIAIGVWIVFLNALVIANGQGEKSEFFKESDIPINKLIIVRLFQSFDSGKTFEYRGLLTIQNNVPNIKQDPITDEQIQLLKNAAKNDAYYYVKAEAYQTLIFEHEKPYQTSLTYLPAKHLLESNLRDQLWISLDSNSKFVSLVENVPYDFGQEFLNSNTFNTSVFYSQTSLSLGFRFNSSALN
ncbi:60S ribosome subunit biogenesis protein [Sarcoptes scabiei]|nr:60S ribosome subunit biogenesis protein [Sarcoptes scabiei]